LPSATSSSKNLAGAKDECERLAADSQRTAAAANKEHEAKLKALSAQLVDSRRTAATAKKEDDAKVASARNEHDVELRARLQLQFVATLPART
jgi:hypothetical protein